jgi:hypothetical protein
MLKKVLIAAIATGATLAAVSSASAADGCGRGFHRGPYGGCRPNFAHGPAVVGPVIPAIGVYYGGRGYWDGHRYWGHRYAWHGGWRYR